MSVSNIIDPVTNKIYPQYVPGAGSVPLTKGELITALANQTEVALPTGPNGTFLSATTDPTNIYGLNWSAIPGATPLAQGQLLSANLAGTATVVTAPVFPAQANYVMTAVQGNALSPNMLWQPVTGAGGIIDTFAPLIDVTGAGTNKIGIGFQGGGAGFAGQVPYGNGTANVGALTNIPASGTQFLGVTAGVPAWKDLGGSGLVTATAPLIESAGLNNVSNIAINFPATVGSIPYGNGTASTGALTNIPTSGTQFLGVTAGVPAWKDLGASGSVTATFPLLESAGLNNASNIAIGFTARGDLPVGANPGAGVAGVILPSSNTDGDILTVLKTAPSGLAWQTPSSASGVIINRSPLATQAVLPPPTLQSTMVLVGEEPNASWNSRPDPTTGSVDTYQTEFITEAVPSTLAGAVYQMVGFIVEINNMRCVDLYLVDNTGVSQQLGHVYNDDYKQPAYVKCYLVPSGTVGSRLRYSFLLGGLWTQFLPTEGQGGVELESYNMLTIDCQALDTAPNPVILVLPDSVGNIDGYFNDPLPPPGNPLPFISQYIIAGTELYIFGYFNALKSNSGANNGLGSISLWDTVAGTFTNNLDLNNAGLGVYQTPIPGEDAGFIVDARVDGAYILITGQFEELAIDNATRFPAPCFSFAVLNTAIPAGSNRWVNTPPDLAPALLEGYCLHPSASIPNTTFIITESGAPYIWNNTTPTVITKCPGVYPSGDYDTSGFKTVAGGAVNLLGTGIATYDVILYQDTVASPATSKVVYFTGGSTTLAGTLLPNPTGMVPLDSVNVSNPFLGRSCYGIQYFPVVGPVPASINVASIDAVYEYDPNTAPSLAFTLGPSPKGFYYDGVLYNTATFAIATLANEAQSFVASRNLEAWIQIGAKTTNLTYS